MSDHVTPLPWRGSTTSVGVIVADDPAPDESPLGRAEADAVAYYGGVIVAESMRTVDRAFAIRAANEYLLLNEIAAAFNEYADQLGVDEHAAMDAYNEAVDAAARLKTMREAT